MLLPGSPAEWSYFSKDTFIWKCLLHNFINFLFLQRGRTLLQPPQPLPLRWPWHNALYYLYAFKMTVRKNSSVFSHSQPRTPTVTFHKWKNHRWRRLIVDNHSFWGNANSWIKFVRDYQSWSNLICSLINLCTLLWFKLRKFWVQRSNNNKTDFNFCTGWCTLHQQNFKLQPYPYVTLIFFTNICISMKAMSSILRLIKK